MFKVGDLVVHKRDICKITAIVEKYRDDTDFYTLTPITDETLIIRTPTTNKHHLIRKIISKQEALDLIKQIPNISALETTDKPNDRTLENEYNNLINSGKHKDLIVIIKTAYVRKELKTNSGLKASEKDKTFFSLAEKLLYNELSIALGKSYNEIRDYITKKIIES